MKTLMLLNPRKRKKSKRSSAKRKSYAPKRRRSVARKVVRRKTKRLGSLKVMLNPRKKKMRRNPRRRASGKGIVGQLKNVISKENIQLAGGAVGASFLTQIILARYGSKLPMAQADANGNAPGRMLYTLGIPVAGALLTHRFSPALAQGMILGGLIDTMTIAISSYVPGAREAVTGTGEYLDYTPAPVGALPPGYSGMNQFGNIRPVNGALDDNSAFKPDAWSN
jgi:hypothetical protein